VVCTPGRLIDILCMQAGKLVSLKRVTMVVLDEADRCVPVFVGELVCFPDSFHSFCGLAV
jgi:hypothetical protein